MSFINVFVHNQNDYWSLEHKITVHTDTKLIYINDAVTDFDIKIDLYSDLKEWFKLRENSGIVNFPIRSIGGDPTVSGQTAGDIYFMVDGWRVVIDLRNVAVTGVLFSDDYTSAWLNSDDLKLITPIQVSSLVTSVTPQLDQFGIPTATENAAATWNYATNSLGDTTTVGGMIMDHLHNLDYAEKIWVDTNNGTSGTTYPIGTRGIPVLTIADALIIAITKNISIIQIFEDAVIQATDDISGYIIMGSHALKSEITLTAGCTTTFTQFVGATITGTLNGEVVIRDCRVDSLLDFEGILHQTLIDPGGIRLANGSAKPSHILSCYSGKPGDQTPEIDYNGVDVELGVRDYIGGIKIVNKTGAAPLSLDVNPGQVILDGTVTNGPIVVRGNCKLTDNSGGAVTLIDDRASKLVWADSKGKLAALNLVK